MTSRRATRTYLDAGVLLTAHRSTLAERERGYNLITDSARVFIASNFLVLEVLPKAVYFKQKNERKFYEDFFNLVSVWQEPATSDAYVMASRYGLAALDALHLTGRARRRSRRTHHDGEADQAALPGAGPRRGRFLHALSIKR